MDLSVTIEGERFHGVFKAEEYSQPVLVGSEATEHEVTGVWYKGAGLIREKGTRRQAFFVLKTFLQKDDPRYSLSESVVYYNQKGPFYFPDRESEVVEGMFPKIADLSLEDMFTRAVNATDELPVISPQKLSLDYLVKRGYCTIKSDLPSPSLRA